MPDDRFDKLARPAKQVLALAQEEAQRFNHNYIGTEHFLLGLVRQGGVAGQNLTDLGVDLTKVRNAVEFIIGRGNRAPVGEIGLTPRARKVIELAVDEARRLGHHYIGTEHLLLGLVREGEGIAAGVLMSLGVNLTGLRRQTLLALGVTADIVFAPDEPRQQAGSASMQNDRFDKFSRRARQVLALAQEEAQRRNHNYIGTEHLLVALVREGEGVAAKVLANLGLHLEPLLAAMEAAAAGGAAPREIGLTAEARRVIEYAVDEARRLGHRYIGTEHLLLGLGRQQHGPAAALLAHFHLDLQQLRQQTSVVLAQLGAVAPPADSAGPPGVETPSAGPSSGPAGAAMGRRLPELGALRRVIAIGTTERYADAEITLLALEAYERGFLLSLRVLTAETDRPAPLTFRFPFVRKALTASDDRGGRYTPDWRDGRSGPRESRFELGFTPALDPAARQLRLEAPAIDPRSLDAAYRAAAPAPDLTGPWSFSIAIPPDVSP